MARSKSDQGPQLAAAYAELVKRDEAVTVRALRAQAGTSTTEAADWLRAHRPADEVPPVPVDDLTSALAVLWSAAVTAARDEHATERSDRENTLIGAEALALEEAATALARVIDLEAALETARTHTAQSEAQLQSQLATVSDQLSKEAARADREATIARDAEARAVRAEATAETLQRIVDEHITPRK